MRWPMALALLSACVEFGINPIEPDGQADRRVSVTDSFVQRALPKVDVLLVVDQTASMAQEHAALANNLTQMIGQLASEDISWQLGVVGTSMGSAESGWLQGRPWVMTPTTVDLQTRFDELFQVRSVGPLEESGIAAAIRALDLSRPGQVNAGFRRHDAALHVLFISDADDDSDGLTDGDALTVFIDLLRDQALNKMPAVASAVVGDVPDGCVSELGAAEPGYRYAEVAEATEGQVLSICAGDFGALLGDLGRASIVYQDRFSLHDEPIAGTVRVAVDGATVDNWSLANTPTEVVFTVPPAGGSQIVVSYLVAVGP